MDIKANDVQKLRAMTGAGMMDAKQALREAKGDLDKALEFLRKQGQKIAEKKSNREASEGFIGVYLHTNGKVAAMVKLKCETDFVARTDEFKNLAIDLAMQVAAMAPQYLSPDDIPAAMLAKEREIYETEVKKSSKPPAVTTKIVDGKMDKFFSQVCLLKQSYIKDDSVTIEKLIADRVATIGENIKVAGFVRLSF